MIIQLKDVENGEYITEFEVNGDVQDAIMVANELTNLLHAELIQIIGGVIVLYRKNLKEPKIKLPK